jgi:hypothetical protein
VIEVFLCMRLEELDGTLNGEIGREFPDGSK